MYATCISLLTEEMIGTTLIEPVAGVVWGVGTRHILYTPVFSTQCETYYICRCTHIPSRKLTQYSAVATSHNYMLFFKECPIPISSVPISSTSSYGTSKSTGLILALQFYKKSNEIRQKLFIKKYCNVGMAKQWSLAKKEKKSDVGLVTG